jgi:methylmalonyl-CoA mutase cobalamin-binding domain/chain
MADLNKVKDLFAELDEDGLNEEIDAFVQASPSADDANAFVDACQKGMEAVGNLFETGEYFVGDLLFAAELITGALDKVKPFMSADAGGASKGKLAIGTVEGDIHDIGKNIVASLADAAGFEVEDLGIDVKPEAFVQAAKDGADIIGLSGVLTLSIQPMKKVVEALKEAGLRDNVKVMIGGSAVTEGHPAFTGADYGSRNAAAAIKQMSEYMA